MTSTTQSRTRSAAKKKKNANASSPAKVDRWHGSQFVADLETHAPWEVWARKLAGRKRPVSLHKLLKQPHSPLEWSLESDGDAETLQRLRLLDSLKRHWHRGEPADWSAVTDDWLSVADSRELSVPFALECLAWSHALSRLAVRLPAENWWDLFSFLLNTAGESQTLRTERDQAEAAVVAQLFAGELPLTLAYCFPRVEACAELAKPAREAISEGIIELLDGEGMPHARYVRVWRGILASWTRCMHLDQNVPASRIDKTARLQYEWLVRQSLRWWRKDGRFVFEEGPKRIPHGDELLQAALNVGGDHVDHDLFRCVTGDLEPARSAFELPIPGEHSEWAEAAILRTNWGPDSAYLGLTFHASRLTTELGDRDVVIWSGEDVPDVRVDTEPLEITSEWEELCWSSDQDMDYIELELRLSGPWKLQRQMLLARRDRFLYVADALVGGTKPSKIDYCRAIPLTDQIQLVQDEETAEIGIRSKRYLGCLVPLALSEWKVDRSLGQFDGRVLRQRTIGTALYAPLFVDLEPKRQRKARTWRQLTVAQQLRLVNRDGATAYRVQIGQQQWVFYRALSGAENRTFLGQNVINEFLAARFTREGEIETLIEIE